MDRLKAMKPEGATPLLPIMDRVIKEDIPPGFEGVKTLIVLTDGADTTWFSKIFPDETFDASRHKLTDSETAPADARIGETLAPGFTYQGRLLRPALVKLKTAEVVEPESPTNTPEVTEPTLL